ERSGGLILIHGAPDPPSKKKWWNRKPGNLGPWIVLALLIAGVLLAASLASGWQTVAETAKSLLVLVR
ncbi:MAG TPA: hypothetical protein VGW37_14345, partial [Terriglobia bacterium]|nr:hypothetical protein [Terriglobia bacterium]